MDINDLSSITEKELSFRTDNKKIKKTKIKKNSKISKKDMIKEAVDDINKEIANMKLQKKKLNQQISLLDKGLENSRESERELQKKITELIRKETLLKEEKKRISQDQGKLAEKLLRIQKIKTELDYV